MTYEKKLKLRGRPSDRFVCFPADDEENALIVGIETCGLDGEVTLSFKNDSYRIVREHIYVKGAQHGRR